ncbi:MAG: hypothetical protein FJZ01_26855 [Candidatus Sericytochromatia bacterium]|nr:hypothetical protein [Candidatus Tanganyikabacteria bacterium]
MNLAAAPQVPGLAAHWAAARLEDEDTWAEFPRGKVAGERLKIALRHGLLSNETAFVVIENREGERKAKALAMMATAVTVPVNAPAGWGMFSGATGILGASLGAIASVAAPGMMFFDRGPIDTFEPSYPPPDEAERPMVEFEERAQEGLLRRRARHRRIAADPFTTQLADGLWGRPGATREALRSIHEAGLTAQDNLRGRQIRKAVEAVLSAVEDQAVRRDKTWLQILALTYLVAGRRLMPKVEAAAKRFREFEPLASAIEGGEDAIVSLI